MAIHDPIGDFITIIRNASTAGKATCIAPHSKLRAGVAAILKGEGYIKDFREDKDERGHKTLVIDLKYVKNKPAIAGIKRESKPGRRIYYGYDEIPRVLEGLGISILTTSRGVLKDRDARSQKIGGEVLCQVW